MLTLTTSLLPGGDGSTNIIPVGKWGASYHYPALPCSTSLLPGRWGGISALCLIPLILPLWGRQRAKSPCLIAAMWGQTWVALFGTAHTTGKEHFFLSSRVHPQGHPGHRGNSSEAGLVLRRSRLTPGDKASCCTITSRTSTTPVHCVQ